MCLSTLLLLLVIATVLALKAPYVQLHKIMITDSRFALLHLYSKDEVDPGKVAMMLQYYCYPLCHCVSILISYIFILQFASWLVVQAKEINISS